MASLIIIIILYVGIFYYLFVVRRKKEQKKMEDLMSSVKEGVRIRTLSGICAAVVTVNESDLIVDISADYEKTIRARLHKGAVRSVE